MHLSPLYTRSANESSHLPSPLLPQLSFSSPHLPSSPSLPLPSPLLPFSVPPRFLRHVPVIYVDYPGASSLAPIYGTFNHAMLRHVPNLRAYADPLTNAMVEFYTMSQVCSRGCYTKSINSLALIDSHHLPRSLPSSLPAFLTLSLLPSLSLPPSLPNLDSVHHLPPLLPSSMLFHSYSSHTLPPSLSIAFLSPSFLPLSLPFTGPIHAGHAAPLHL